MSRKIVFSIFQGSVRTLFVPLSLSLSSPTCCPPTPLLPTTSYFYRFQQEAHFFSDKPRSQAITVSEPLKMIITKKLNFPKEWKKSLKKLFSCLRSRLTQRLVTHDKPSALYSIFLLYLLDEMYIRPHKVVINMFRC